jgi:glutathione S-transferase
MASASLFLVAGLDSLPAIAGSGYAGYEVDVSRWPNLVGLVARVRAQPQVAAVLEKEQRALGLD